MSFADWNEDELKIVEKGMNLLGWQIDMRLTADDALLTSDIAMQAIEHNDNNTLTKELIEDLSKKMFHVLNFQVMNKEERARSLCCRYNKSSFLYALIPLVDESLLCYYRGYYTASLALLFIILEKALRSIYGWKPGDKDPSFAELRNSVLNLPNKNMAQLAHRIISIIYARYDSTNPPLFYFNRHGLLHGIRGPIDIDIMNCCRIYQLFDIICNAENIGNSIFGKELETFMFKVDIFKGSNLLTEEQNLLSFEISGSK